MSFVTLWAVTLAVGHAFRKSSRTPIVMEVEDRGGFGLHLDNESRSNNSSNLSAKASSKPGREYLTMIQQNLGWELQVADDIRVGPYWQWCKVHGCLERLRNDLYGGNTEEDFWQPRADIMTLQEAVLQGDKPLFPPGLFEHDPVSVVTYPATDSPQVTRVCNPAGRELVQEDVRLASEKQELGEHYFFASVENPGVLHPQSRTNVNLVTVVAKRLFIGSEVWTATFAGTNNCGGETMYALGRPVHVIHAGDFLIVNLHAPHSISIADTLKFVYQQADLQWAQDLIVKGLVKYVIVGGDFNQDPRFSWRDQRLRDPRPGWTGHQYEMFGVTLSKEDGAYDDHTCCRNHECDESTSGPKGSEYTGCQRFTKTGKMCQRWDKQDPHTHDHSFTEKHNLCRNPAQTRDGIWCYTLDPTVEWEYCHRKDEHPKEEWHHYPFSFQSLGYDYMPWRLDHTFVGANPNVRGLEAPEIEFRKPHADTHYTSDHKQVFVTIGFALS